MVHFQSLLVTTLLVGAATRAAAVPQGNQELVEARNLQVIDQKASAFVARAGKGTPSTPAPAAPKKDAAPPPKPAPAPAPAAPKNDSPKTENKTTVSNTNVNKSTNSNANLSGNSGTMVNSGNTIGKQDNCNVSINKRDLSLRTDEERQAHLAARAPAPDANSDWLTAGANFQLQQQQLQVQQVQAMNNKCVCNCKRAPSSLLLGADGFDRASMERRQEQNLAAGRSGISISDPSALVMRAVLEPRCSIKQEPSGRHVWSGRCARSTLEGAPITSVLEAEA